MAVFYGVIQGLTEFLPVSSSAHLALMPKFFNFTDPGLTFDLAMHLGTALAISIYFRLRLFILLKEFFVFFIPGHAGYGKKQMVLNMFFSTLFSFFLILLLKPISSNFGRNPQLIAFNLIFFAILMFFADRRIEGKVKEMNKKKSWKVAVSIGIAQAFAIFPGVSRSGVTITAARFFNISRLESSQYSFLLSLPIIFGGAFLKFREMDSMISFSYSQLIIGILVSLFVGLLTIHLFLQYISKIGLQYFVYYRIILAGIILLIL